MFWAFSTGKTCPTSGIYSTVLSWYNSIVFKSMIVSHSWNIGDVGGTSNTYIGTRSAVISYEDNSSTSAFVGILSLTDYYLAYKGDQNWNSSYSNYTSNWIHLANNGNTSDSEWTMTRLNTTLAWYLRLNGQIGDNNRMDTSSGYIRPTFFLDSNVKRLNATGTSTDPFIVSH